MRKKTTNALNRRETAACQRRTRQQHAQERAQDYVETIADLIASCGEASATDLAWGHPGKIYRNSNTASSAIVSK
jgi:hypothetical protein